MTEKEFTDIAAELRNLALKHGQRYVSADEAGDIAQDTMLRLWSLHDKLPMDKASGMAVTIARHLAIDRLRGCKTVSIDGFQRNGSDGFQRNTSDALPGAALVAVRQSPDAALEDKQNEEWLKKHLKQLPSNEYLVLHLRQVERKNNAEIAAILGIKPESVPVLLSRARHKLYDSLKKRK